MDLNKVMIIGRLTRDPELRTVPSGVSVAHVAVATNYIYTDQSGAKQENVEFHDVVMWRRLAEIASQYLKKGAKVYIEGRLKTRSWDDPNGFKRYKTEIVADSMIMLDRPPQFTGASAFSSNNSRVPSAGKGADYVNPAYQQSYPSLQPNPESILENKSNLAVPPSAKINAEEDIPIIDISKEDNEDEEDVSVEDIPF